MTQVAFTASHHLATQAGMKILQQGGNAIEAMVAAAATISVAYPHMTGLGGDGFWLIHKPGEKPVAIDATGFSALAVNREDYAKQSTLPTRGGKAAITIGGAVSGWHQALMWAQKELDSKVDLSLLLNDALTHAKNGIEISETLAITTQNKYQELVDIPGFSANFLKDGKPLVKGEILKQPGLVNLFESLINNGLEDFFQGEIANNIAQALADAGSPLSIADFNDYKAQFVEPLQSEISKGTLFNLCAPTQGIASLIILALYDRVYQDSWSELERVHHLVECTKQAFMLRDKFVTDPQRLKIDLEDLLESDFLDKLSLKIESDKALDWPYEGQPGDTIWMGAVDKDGVMVSYIQSLYWEFGSGVVVPEYGLVWNNRGVGFSLQKGHINELAPRVKPFTTLNPALCLFKDGRRMVYGTMGGEGQPQTQAAVFSRITDLNLSPEKAIAEPRWLLGRTWGDSQNNLKLEQSLANRIGTQLKNLGHDIEVVDDLAEMMGHAGAIMTDLPGLVKAGSDPRSDGVAMVCEV
ncbi:gamma-glutamyltransferase family protein [Thiomicrorhabdus hydrogeniphila]